MSSRVLGGRDNDESGGKSLAAGVVSSAKRHLLRATTPLDYTPPGKENVAFRLSANTAVDQECDAEAKESRLSRDHPPTDGKESRASSDTPTLDNTISTMDNAFLAETSTATFGSDADLSEDTSRSGSGVSAETRRMDEEESDEDEGCDNATAGSRVIYQDRSTLSPENIDLKMDTPTSGLPAVRKFCGDNSALACCTPLQQKSSTLVMRTPIHAHDCTLESIAPTDVDESFAVGGVGDMPPLGAPSFRRYAALLSPTSNDGSVDDLSDAAAATPQKRRSDVQDPVTADKPEAPLYARPVRLPTRSSGSVDSSASSLMSQGDSCTDSGLMKKPCSPLHTLESPVAPSPAHGKIMEKIQHLRQVVERDSNLEKQARRALELCLASDSQGTQQELEAERLLLMAGLRSTRCSSDIERLRQQVATPIISSACDEMAKTCQAELILSDFNLPICLNFLSTLGRDSVAHFAIVARCGCDVVATTHVQSTQDIVGLGGELKFKDHLTLSPVPVGTQLDIEVYYMVLGSRKGSESDQVAGAPRKRRLLGQHSALSKLTPRKQRTGSTPSTPVSQTLMTRFTLGASYQLPVDSLQSFMSFKMQEWTGNQLMLGGAEVRVSGRPLYSQHKHSGFLTWREEISGQPNWRRFWCELDGLCLRAWQYPADQEAEMEPMQRLDLAESGAGGRQLRASVPSALVCVRKNSIIINVTDDNNSDLDQLLFFADSKLSQGEWVSAFQQACSNLAAWRKLPGSVPS